MKHRELICPRCKKTHDCPNVWYMYRRDDWMGYVSMIYCEKPLGDGYEPIFKLYDDGYRFIAWVTSMTSAMSTNLYDEIPF